MLLSIAAALLVILVVWDVFITIFSPNGVGPLTSRWTPIVWAGLLYVHHRRPIHRLLSLAGPAMLFGTIVLWYALLGVGLYLSIAAQPDSVVSNSTGKPVGPAEKIYFVTTTISSIGYGDLVPSRMPWTVVCTTASVLATIVLTASLSYVLSVLAASIERRALAQGVFGLGETAPEFIGNVRLHVAKDSLKEHFTTLCNDVTTQAMKHLAYPVLDFFHTPQPERSLSRAVLLLSDAVFLMGQLPPNQRPPVGLLKLAESSLDSYAALAHASRGASSREDRHPDHLVAAASELGLTDGDRAAFDAALKEYLPRRQRFVEVCWDDGWDED